MLWTSYIYVGCVSPGETLESGDGKRPPGRAVVFEWHCSRWPDTADEIVTLMMTMAMVSLRISQGGLTFPQKPAPSVKPLPLK